MAIHRFSFRPPRSRFDARSEENKAYLCGKIVGRNRLLVSVELRGNQRGDRLSNY